MDRLITKVEIIEQPYSGEFKEVIYDIPNKFHSQDWAWIKFEDENWNEWCRQFRGAPIAAVLSEKYKQVLVLTSDYLVQINCINGKLTQFEAIYESQRIYQDLTVTPSGEFIIADYYDIEVIGNTLSNRKLLDKPMAMDMIKFNGWSNDILSIVCDELGTTRNKVALQLDASTFEISFK